MTFDYKYEERHCILVFLRSVALVQEKVKSQKRSDRLIDPSDVAKFERRRRNAKFGVDDYY